MSRLPLLLILLVAGCDFQTAKDKTIPASEPVLSQQFRKESVTAIISISKTNMTTTGKVQLMLDVHAPPGTEVIFPEISSFIEPFSISRSYSEPQQTLPNGKTLHRQVWILVPALPGEVLFQPLEIFANNKTITTDPITIKVDSILPAGLKTFEIKDIAAPAALLPEQEKKHRLGIFLLGSALFLALLVSGIRFFRRTKIIPMIPPHKTAIQALGNLPAEPAARIHELNRILRHYIESCFALPMIGKTAAEYLPLLENTDIQGQTPELIRFFEAGEQIRFSNLVPDGFTEEAEHVIREFIETTKPEEPCA